MAPSLFSSFMDKMQGVRKEQRDLIVRFSLIALVLPIFVLGLIPLLTPKATSLPNAGLIQLQLRDVNANVEIGYYSMCLGHWNESYTVPYIHACLGTNDRSAGGETLARRWGNINRVSPDIYRPLAKSFQTALNIQRGSFYPNLLVAALVFWGISLGMLVAASVSKKRRGWVPAGAKGLAVLGVLLMLVATVATDASVHALKVYIPRASWYSQEGRRGAALSLQWGATAAMALYAWLTFAVIGGFDDETSGSIMLEV